LRKSSTALSMRVFSWARMSFNGPESAMVNSFHRRNQNVEL